MRQTIRIFVALLLISATSALANFEKKFPFMGQTLVQCDVASMKLTEQLKLLPNVRLIESGCVKDDHFETWSVSIFYSAPEEIKFVSTVSDHTNSYSPAEGYFDEAVCLEQVDREKRQFVDIHHMNPILEGCYYNPEVRLYGIRFIAIGDTEYQAGSIGFSVYGKINVSGEELTQSLETALNRLPNVAIRSAYMTKSLAFDQVIARFYSMEYIFADQFDSGFDVFGIDACEEIVRNMSADFARQKVSALGFCQADPFAEEGAQNLIVASFGLKEEKMWVLKYESPNFYESKEVCEQKRAELARDMNHLISSFCYQDSHNEKKYRFGMLLDNVN